MDGYTLKQFNILSIITVMLLFILLLPFQAYADNNTNLVNQGDSVEVTENDYSIELINLEDGDPINDNEQIEEVRTLDPPVNYNPNKHNSIIALASVCFAFAVIIVIVVSSYIGKNKEYWK